MKSKETNTINIVELIKEKLFKGLEEELFTEEFTLKNLGDNKATAKHLQYWSENGLLPDKERKTDENHKFNFVELIWMKMVYDLRVIRFPLHRIKILKELLLKKITLHELLGLKDASNVAEFYYNHWKDKIKDKEKFIQAFSSKETIKHINSNKFPLLSFLILLLIIDKANCRIIIFNSGEIKIFIEKYSDADLDLKELMEKETYISISLFKLMIDFINDKSNYTFLSKSRILNDDELRILSIVRSDKFETITVHFKKQKAFLIELKSKLKISKEVKLSEILLKGGYEKIEIVTQGGNIAYSPKTTKIFL